MAHHTAPIVVGVDGSEASQGALRWAADEAFRQARPLRIVHALGLPGPFGWTEDGQAVVHDAADLAYGWHFTIEVETAVVVGSAAMVLCEESHRAALVVVGSRGYGGFHGLLVGSVGIHLSTHGAAPVLVVHGAERWAGPENPLPHDAPVVVGVDGSPGSTRALRLAFDEVGTRRTGGFAGLRLGSVSQQVLHHATVPVLIARAPDEA
jgi:nucleotide-binding universal stress UspA family protein